MSGMYSDCFRNGQNGNCNPECHQFQRGECDEPQEFQIQDIVEDLGISETIHVIELYPCFKEETEKLKKIEKEHNETFSS